MQQGALTCLLAIVLQIVFQGTAVTAVFKCALASKDQGAARGQGCPLYKKMLSRELPDRYLRASERFPGRVAWPSSGYHCCHRWTLSPANNQKTSESVNLAAMIRTKCFLIEDLYA